IILLFFLREVANVFIDQHELGQRGNVETGCSFEKCANDRWLGIGFYGVIALNFGKVFLKCRVILSNRVVVNDYQGRAMVAGEGLELPEVHSVLRLAATASKLLKESEFPRFNPAAAPSHPPSSHDCGRNTPF